MAVYKVIQDIESEDKLFGPLTLKSFVYAAISVLLLYINFRLVFAAAPLALRSTLIFFLFFPMVLFAVLASPLGRQQPTEVWLLAHIKFWVKPRKRVWDQSGLKKLVTVTVPKKIERQLTKDFSQNEVRSRLEALASTLDSRGWAIKNIAVNSADMPGYLDGARGDSDRLIGTSSIPQEVTPVDVHPSDDMLDESSSVTAQNFAALVRESENKRKKELAEKIKAAQQEAEKPKEKLALKLPQLPSLSQLPQTKSEADSQPVLATFVKTSVVTPGQNTELSSQYGDGIMTDSEMRLLDKKHRELAEIESKMPKNFNPRAQHHQAPQSPIPAVTPEAHAAKIELAQSGNDLSVASIAQLANRVPQARQVSANEVVLSLH